MTGIDHLPLFIAAGLLLNLTPGPDVLYIVTHALRSGARAGMVAALGITAGCFVHIAAATIGVSALMSASALAFTVVKWLGAAYLVYVGLGLLLSRAKSIAVQPLAEAHERGGAVAPANLWRVFTQGFWTNALNPKVALFFLAFLPQFITPDAPAKTTAFLLLGLLFNFNGLWINLGWALAGAWLAARFASLRRSMHWLDRLAGALFVSFGLKLAMSDNPVS